LATAIVLLYLRRVRLPREPVATDVFWQRALAEERSREAWRRWRHPVSLGVQLTVLLLLVLAMAEPLIPGPRRLVLILDNSASMTATDCEPTRLAAARLAAERLIDGLRPCDTAAVLTAGGEVGVRSTFCNDRSMLREAVRSVATAGGTTRVDAAVAMARRMVGEASDGEILVLGDGRFPNAAKLVAADDVELIRVGSSSDNVALTRLAARRNPDDPQTCQMLAEVTNFSGKTVRCDLQLKLDGKPVGKATIEARAEASSTHIFDEVAVPGAARLTGRIDNRDARPDDNEKTLKLPSATIPQDDAPPDVGSLAVNWAIDSESDLRVPEKSGTDVVSLSSSGPGVPPWLILVLAAVAISAGEWCLYQRRWMS